MEPVDKELIDPLVEPASEKAHRLTRACLSVVPGFGGALVETFNTIIEPPMEKRKREWMIQITDAINRLMEQHQETEETLQNNEVFITALIHASTAALRNHQSEKIRALRNAVYNSVATSIEENKALLFIKVLDEITPVHMLVLNFLNDPDYFKKQLQKELRPNTFVHYPGNQAVWEEYYPEYKRQSEFINHIVKELHLLSFVHQPSLPGSIGRTTTEYGREFLSFIKNENGT